MITSVTYRPHNFTPAYNPIMFTFLSNENYRQDFVYVVDIYVNGATGDYTYRLKQRPSPSGYGVVDVSSIVSPYIDLSEWNPEYGADTSDYFLNSEDTVASVYLKVGEQYSPTGGTLTTFDGFGATGEPAYNIFSRLNTTQTLTNQGLVYALPASLNPEEEEEHMVSTATGGFYSPYIMSSTTNGEFLTRQTGVRELALEDKHTLTFLNWNPSPANSYEKPVQLMAVEYVHPIYGPIIDNFYNTTPDGGGPQTVDSYSSVDQSRQSTQLTFKCGPLDLWVTPPYPSSYTVTAWVKPAGASGSTAPGATASETISFEIVDYCEDLYPKIRLSWLNDIGGRDYYNFTMFYEKRTTSKEETYYQTPYNWSGSTPVDMGNPSNNWLRGGNKSFNKTITTDFTVQSDWLTQDEIQFLGGIPESPSVWAYLNGGTSAPVTVTVTNLEYTYKNIGQVKLAQATFNCTINKKQTRQNL